MASPAPPLTLPSRPALLIVDMQNSFLHNKGAFQQTGLILPSEKVNQTIATIQRLRKAFNNKSLPVIFAQYALNPDFSDAGILLDPFPQLKDLGYCIRGTWDAEIIDELKPVVSEKGEISIEKKRMSAFVNSELERVLGEKGVDGLVVVGEATNVCVETTVRDAASRDWKCIVVRDGCVALTDEEHEASLRILGLVFGRVASSGEVVAALERLAL